MKIAIVGGGPSGLFLSILLKRNLPELDIVVHEQNAAQATFGFGVVLADTGLSHIRNADPQVCEALVRAMRFNDRHTIMTRETPITMRRPGLGGGAIPRIRLLEILQSHAQTLGVPVHYESRITNFDALGADLVVGADGVNSQVRESDAAGFDVRRYNLSNHFAWYGVDKVFTNPALVFRKALGGYFVAHYYPYSDAMSTFVAECDHQTWLDLGMQDMDDERRRQLFEQVFAGELEGSGLLSNHSVWRQFPVVRAQNWHVGNRVLIGDALNSAHFSIGSGTRIAMEDAIALARAIVAHRDDIPAALARYVDERGPQKQKLIGASEASFNWYEKIRDWIDAYEPQEFVLRFMTRTGRVGAERLHEQYPDLVRGFEAAGLSLDAAGVR